MTELIINSDYQPILSLLETEKAIKFVKDNFQDNLADALNLQRVSAPLFVRTGTGINDDLNGIERKVAFTTRDGQAPCEIVFSLAKWKRMVLADYGFGPDQGLYTDMNAIRPDEESLDNLHSAYVDQWDWERVMTAEQRNLDFLKQIVRAIYSVLTQAEQAVARRYPQIAPILPEEIAFVHTEDLCTQYPDLTPRQREHRATKEHGAVFIIGIGGPLPDGTIHDGRAPDYDDWITATTDGKKGLNGDIFVWNPVLECAFELSSMGIRVNDETLLQQLEIRNVTERKEMQWHQKLLNGDLPLSIGGGIGQSRLCMLLLRKMHIGEVHASVWPEETITKCRAAGIPLL